ncbi:MAG: prenyltransferase [Oscillospiraceae bacterium]
MPSLLSAVLAYADTKRLDLPMAALVLLACILMQSAANALNDYNDFLKGTDTVENSPDRRDAVIVYGLSPKTALTAGLAFLLAAAAIGAYICAARGPALLMACSVPRRWPGMSRAAGRPRTCPWGAALRFVMGALIAGRVLRADGPVQAEPPAGDLPVVLGIALIMLTNNGCDTARDSTAGRRTLPCLLGERRTRRLYRWALALWAASPVLIMLAKGAPAGAAVSAAGIALLSGALARQFRLSLGPVARAAAMRGIVRLNALIGLVYGLALLTEVWL